MTAISVIMPVRNGERFLAEAIGSVLAQSFADFDLVVILDHSTDSSARIAHEVASQDRRVRVLDNLGEGLVDALNAGVAASAGEFLARLDADDRMREGRLERQREILLGSSDISLVGSAAIVIDAASREVGRIRVPNSDAALRQRLPRGNPFVHSSVTMRRSAFTAAGGYRRDFPLNEDYDLWLRLAGVGGLANLSAPLVDHRRHGAGVSERFTDRQHLQRLLCLLEWKRACGVIDAAAHRRLGDLFERMFARIADLAADPMGWREGDLRLFTMALPQLGAADARRLARLVAEGHRRGAVSRAASVRFRLHARLTSRFAYDRVCRSAVRRLQERAPPSPSPARG